MNFKGQYSVRTEDAKPKTRGTTVFVDLNEEFYDLLDLTKFVPLIEQVSNEIRTKIEIRTTIEISRGLVFEQVSILLSGQDFSYVKSFILFFSINKLIE